MRLKFEVSFSLNIFVPSPYLFHHSKSVWVFHVGVYLKCLDDVNPIRPKTILFAFILGNIFLFENLHWQHTCTLHPKSSKYLVPIFHIHSSRPNHPNLSWFLFLVDMCVYRIILHFNGQFYFTFLQD